MLLVIFLTIAYATRHAIPILKQQLMGTEEICTIDAKYCLMLKPYWFSPIFLNSHVSIGAAKRSSFFSIKDIDRDFSNSLLITFVPPAKEFHDAATTNYAGLKKYTWGTLLTLSSEFHIKTANKYSVFGDFYYIPEIEGIISCKDISCVDDIVSISKSTVP